jgi:hypothetical protein
MKNRTAMTEDCTPQMLTEGARALSLWSDESLREEIDGRRMAELVWQAMAPHNPSRYAPADRLREIVGTLEGLEQLFEDRERAGLMDREDEAWRLVASALRVVRGSSRE